MTKRATHSASNSASKVKWFASAVRAEMDHIIESAEPENKVDIANSIVNVLIYIDFIAKNTNIDILSALEKMVENAKAPKLIIPRSVMCSDKR